MKPAPFFFHYKPLAAARARFGTDKPGVFLVLQRSFHQEMFVTVSLAPSQLYSGRCDFQSFCKQFNDRLVGFAIRRRGCRADLQAAIPGAGYFVGFRTGLNANGDVQVVALDTCTGIKACR